MAIIKQARNMRIIVRGTSTIIGGSIYTTAEQITKTATEGNFTLISNKKIIIQSNLETNTDQK